LAACSKREGIYKFDGFIGKAINPITLDTINKQTEDVLESTHQRILALGSDSYLGRYYFVLGLLEIAKYNINQNQDPVRFFERGPVFVGGKERQHIGA